MHRRHRFLILIAVASIGVAVQSERASIASDSDLEIGKPHPPLVLPGLKEGEVLSIDSHRGSKLLLVHFATWSATSREELLRYAAESKRTNGERKFEVIGVAHDVQIDRVRLFAQWKGIDLPIMHDALNLSRITKLPFAVGVDESGFVRALNSTHKELSSEFVGKEFSGGSARETILELPDPRYTRRMADESRQAPEACKHGDALVLGGLPPQVDEAIKMYQKSIDLKSKDPYAWFRQGVAYRNRYDRADRHEGDLQGAVNAWGDAARKSPKNEVFLDLLRLYGGAEERENCSYAWIAAARNEIAKRGETPIELTAAPLSCELESSDRVAKWRKAATRPAGFEKGATVDESEFVTFEAVTVPSLGDDEPCRALLVFRLKQGSASHWNDQGEPLSVWVQPPNNVKVTRHLLKSNASPASDQADERTLVFDFNPSRKTLKGVLTFKCRAVYDLTDKSGGKPKRWWRDFEFKYAILR